MNSMFSYTLLVYLDLSSFDTENVIDMGSMFCNNLKEIKIRKNQKIMKELSYSNAKIIIVLYSIYF